MTTANRRNFLRNTLATTLVGIATGSGLLNPREVLAATWPADLFDAKDVHTALSGNEGSASNEVSLKTPDIAENGAVVPVTVESTLTNVESISLLVKDNPRPLSAVFILGPGVQPNISTRLKMSKTSNVIAVVKVGDKRLSTAKEVKVTIGGCGG